MLNLYNEQLEIIRGKVNELAEKAQFKKIPTVKTSSSKDFRARASFFGKKIIISTFLLERWKNGEIDQNDVEVTIAHEIGHLMDDEKKFHSAFIRYTLVLALFVSIFLPIFWVINFFNLTLGLTFLAIWFAFLPWIIRKCAIAIQLEADKNGASLISSKKFAESIAKRKQLNYSKRGLIDTWNLLVTCLTFPSLTERLNNLNYEIKQISIQEKK